MDIDRLWGKWSNSLRWWHQRHLLEINIPRFEPRVSLPRVLTKLPSGDDPFPFPVCCTEDSVNCQASSRCSEGPYFLVVRNPINICLLLQYCVVTLKAFEKQLFWRFCCEYCPNKYGKYCEIKSTANLKLFLNILNVDIIS